jgi:hypothetical protein
VSMDSEVGMGGNCSEGEEDDEDDVVGLGSENRVMF